MFWSKIEASVLEASFKKPIVNDETSVGISGTGKRYLYLDKEVEKLVSKSKWFTAALFATVKISHFVLSPTFTANYAFNSRIYLRDGKLVSERKLVLKSSSYSEGICG